MQVSPARCRLRFRAGGYDNAKHAMIHSAVSLYEDLTGGLLPSYKLPETQYVLENTEDRIVLELYDTKLSNYPDLPYRFVYQIHQGQ